MGDGVKGSAFQKYPAEVAKGISLHRFIDSYTDSHSRVEEAREILRPRQGKFSGVVVDVLFDHFLAIRWNEFHDDELGQFANQCYEVIQNQQEILPERSERFYRYMRANNILEQYATVGGIEKVLRGLDSRTRFRSNMLNGIHDLEENFEALDTCFQSFFPELITETKTWIKEH